MRAVLPHPLLSLTLTLVWMALANEVSAGAFVMGLVLGVLLPLATRPFWPDRPLVGRPLRMLEYLFVVLWDIAVANVQVARLVLFVPNHRLRSRYVTVPLTLRSPEAITMTPGTLSAELAADGGAILVHGLDVPDPEALVAEIKTRYEARLLEIFP
jgi:multicomponent K+:H+ antiporter subunit E